MVDSSINVFFCHSLDTIGNSEDGDILVALDDSSWNDFGMKSRVKIRIFHKHDNYHDFSGHIGFLSDKEKKLDEVIFGAKNLLISNDISNPFYTMLSSMEQYRSIVKKFGKTAAIKYLLKLNDLVAFKEFRRRANWLDLAQDSPLFQLSFIRSSEAFFAFMNAGSILHGLAEESLGRISTGFDLRFKLPNFTNEHAINFKFNFDEILPKRISVVIGKNGLGKSQTLRHFIKYALSNNSRNFQTPDGDRPLINRILAFATSSNLSHCFPSDKQASPKVWYRKFSLQPRNRNSKDSTLTNYLIQLARSTESIKNIDRWDIFRKSIKVLNSADQIQLPVKNSKSYLSIDRLNFESEKQFLDTLAQIDSRKEPKRIIKSKAYALSSGEYAYLTLAAISSLFIENGSVLLFDEPENHLHPNFISNFVQVLNSILEQTGSISVIATHSAYFVKEVFKEQVTVLRQDAEMIVCETPRLRTFGEDVGAISFFVFGEDESSQLASEIERKIIKSNLAWEDIYKKYANELSPELLMSIRQKTERK